MASSALAAREELKSAREKRDATIRSRIAPFVKRMREERGMTQGELADAVGFATSCFISRIEDGLAMPSRKQLAAIADALGVSYHRLVNGGLVEGDIFFAREELADAVGVIEGCGGGLDQMVGVALASEIRSYADGSKTPSSEGLAKVVSSLRLSYSDVIGISLDVPACEMRRVLDRFDSLAGYASRQCDRLLPSPVA